MQTNMVPTIEQTPNTTGCCPRFSPEGWRNQRLHFHDKPFVRVTTRSLLHMPLNMGPVIMRVRSNIERANAGDRRQRVVLSHELSPWSAEHFLAVERHVPGEEMTTMTGDYITRVFEGPYRRAKRWARKMEATAIAQGHEAKQVFMFYTTCPKCAKTYEENYVVGVALI